MWKRGACSTNSVLNTPEEGRSLAIREIRMPGKPEPREYMPNCFITQGSAPCPRELLTGMPQEHAMCMPKLRAALTYAMSRITKWNTKETPGSGHLCEMECGCWSRRTCSNQYPPTASSKCSPLACSRFWKPTAALSQHTDTCCRHACRVHASLESHTHTETLCRNMCA